jgi:hypothetical protein
MNAYRKLPNSLEKNKTLRKRFLFCLSIISWIFIAVSALYFRFFPTLVNPIFSDIFITSLIFLLLLSLIIGSFMIQCPEELFLLMPQCLLISFFARCIRYLRLSYPALWDPYAYLVTFLNIHDFGTLEPIYSHWYSGIEGLINWPLMVLITETLSRVAAIDYLWLFNYQQPVLGTIFFLGGYALAYTISRNYGVSLLAGLILSLSSHTIFYQSEYHYQGYAFVIFIFLLVSLLKVCEQKNKTAYKVLALIFIVACTLSHYFSSLFILFILGALFCIACFTSVFSRIYPNAQLNIPKVNWPDGLFIFLLFLLVLSYHLFVFTGHIESYIHISSSATPYQAPVISAASSTVEGDPDSAPFPTNIIKNIRYVVLILGFTSILYTVKTRGSKEIILATMCVFLVALGVLGNTFIYLEVGRIVAFYEVIIGIFVALTLFRLRNIWLKPLNRSIAVTALIGIVTAGVVTLTFFGGHYVPAYYFKSLDQDDYYWCNNNLPDMQKYEDGGRWIFKYVPKNPLILIDSTPYFIKSATFFWGQVPSDNIRGLGSYQYDKLNSNGNTFIASNINGDPGFDEKRIIEQTNRVYFNGEVEITST